MPLKERLVGRALPLSTGRHQMDMLLQTALPLRDGMRNNSKLGFADQRQERFGQQAGASKTMLSSSQEAVLAYSRTLKANPYERINFTLNIWLFLCTAFIIAMIAIAVNFGADGEQRSRGAAFATIWSLLLLCALCFGVNFAVRKRRTNMMIGFFFGVTFAMPVAEFASIKSTLKFIAGHI